MIRKAAALALALTGAAAGSAHPQSPGAPFLLTLGGDPVQVRYSPGSLDRASHVQDRFALLCRRFASWSGQPAPLVIHLLSREDWEATGLARPYGLPQALGASSLALPAHGDGGTVELWRRLLRDELPAVPGIPLTGSPEEVASLALADLLGEVEGARALLEGGFSSGSAWVTALVAQLAARALVERRSGGREELDGLYHRLGASNRAAGPLPLAAYRPDLPAAEWLWFQCRFSGGARRVAGARGRVPVKRLLRTARKAGGRLTSGLLLEVAPGLGPWLRESFPDR